MNANLSRIIAIELMAAAEGIDFRRPLRSSSHRGCPCIVRSVRAARRGP